MTQWTKDSIENVLEKRDSRERWDYQAVHVMSVAGSSKPKITFNKPQPAERYYLIVDCPSVMAEIIQGELPEQSMEIIIHKFRDAMRKQMLYGWNVTWLALRSDVEITFDFNGFIVFRSPVELVDDFDVMVDDNIDSLLLWMQGQLPCPLHSEHGTVAEITRKYI